jgi:hypothetical protein
MTSAPISRPGLTASSLRGLAHAAAKVLTALVATPASRLLGLRRAPSTLRGAPSVVAAGRSMRIVNDHHVDFPRFAGEMPF